MARLVLLATLVAACAVGMSLGIPQPVAAEYCRFSMPDRATETRGYTFRATVTRVRVEGRDPGLTFITLALHQVYANRDSASLASAAAIELYSNACDGFGLLGLQPGDDILMSTDVLAGAGPSTWNSAIWRIDGDRLGLAVLESDVDRVWFTDDRRIEDADTIREALGLVAPEALAQLDSATAEPGGSGDPEWASAAAGAAVALAAAVVVGWRHRRRLHRQTVGSGP